MARGLRRPRVPPRRPQPVPGVAKPAPRAAAPARQSGQQLAGTTLSQTTRPGVKLAPGLSQQFGPDGKPIGFARTGSMKLAPGMRVTYDAQGRASFSREAAPGAPPARAAPQATIPGPITPAPIGRDPHDSQWAAETAQMLADAQGTRDSERLAGERESSDFALSGQRREQARGSDLLGATSGANSQGLLYSSVLGKRRGSIERGYNDQALDAQTGFERSNADRAARLEALDAQLRRDTTEIEGRAVGRATEANTSLAVPVPDRAPEEAPAPQPAPAPLPPAAAPAAPDRGKPKMVVKNGRFYHVYNGGKSASDWVYIRPASK